MNKYKKDYTKDYIEADSLGRKYTKKLCEQYGWGYSSIEGNNTSPDDCLIKAGGKRCMGEIKVRRRQFIDYILEDEKLKNLENALKESTEKIDKVLYINWIVDDKLCYVFDLGDVVDGKLVRNNKLPLREEDIRRDMKYNRHTVESTTDKVYKPVYHLLSNTGIKYEKKEDGHYVKVF